MQSLQHLMTDLEASPQWRSQARLRIVLKVWPQVVGAAVAQHSQPTDLKRQILQVRVTSAAWSQTLTFERLTILQKLRLNLPETVAINDIRFSPGRLLSPSQPLSKNLVWAEHPSRWPSAITPIKSERPNSAISAFHKWQQDLQNRNHAQKLCPSCQCPCPPGELARWDVCSICATQLWQAVIGQAGDIASEH